MTNKKKKMDLTINATFSLTLAFGKYIEFFQNLVFNKTLGFKTILHEYLGSNFCMTVKRCALHFKETSFTCRLYLYPF